MSKWYCYLLVSDGKTYVGATIDPDRRLLQHNGVLSGGAKATHGRVWNRICLVEGFETQREALQFEWRWKFVSKKQKGNAIERRKKALESLMYEPLTLVECLFTESNTTM